MIFYVCMCYIMLYIYIFVLVDHHLYDQHLGWCLFKLPPVTSRVRTLADRSARASETSSRKPRLLRRGWEVGNQCVPFRHDKGRKQKLRLCHIQSIYMYIHMYTNVLFVFAIVFPSQLLNNMSPFHEFHVMNFMSWISRLGCNDMQWPSMTLSWT